MANSETHGEQLRRFLAKNAANLEPGTLLKQQEKVHLLTALSHLHQLYQAIIDLGNATDEVLFGVIKNSVVLFFETLRRHESFKYVVAFEFTPNVYLTESGVKKNTDSVLQALEIWQILTLAEARTILS